ncbi:helix-turn-helix transcriptional regulator [Oleiagrimonas sp. MCCC 1A03011]|uniref:helix-turn-helix transcriptional regulator n=1 Tax=Oleiagrimonas sp. MCCC 1A03011 TaxID=1926883 RepID=UPI001F0B7C14|nr:helix-turn-helix transcriptional regulator [Oleiagrimonas sp. MCCC 1A03011]
MRQELARNIRTLRKSKRLSQEQLALEADVDRTYVSQIERAIGNPSLLVLCKLGVVLDVDICLLLSAE